MSLLLAIASTAFVCDAPAPDAAGTRNGSDPDGDAWFVDDTLVKKMAFSFRYVCCSACRQRRTGGCSSHATLRTCHFKQAGLKLGLPNLASCVVVKMYSTCLSRIPRARRGAAFSSYVTRGKLSKMRFNGGGMEKMLRFCDATAGDDCASRVDFTGLSGGRGSSLDIAIHRGVQERKLLDTFGGHPH